jgi:hypothetical protein
LDTDPEVDLWQRAHNAGYKFFVVPRLTAIKFSASERPGIYRDRPHHEQAEWFERIHNERDLEAAELGKLLALAKGVRSWRETPYAQLLRDLLDEIAVRIRRRLAGMVGPTPAKGEGVDGRRVLKGLERKP